MVYSPSDNTTATVFLNKGESRNYVWELTDDNGQPLPPGSYTARVIFRPTGGEEMRLGLPLWVGE